MARRAAGSNGLTVRQMLPLFGLTLSAFILNTSEFMPVGLLTDIAASFGITESTAGIMITVYAWAVMLLSLPLMMAASRVEFKRLLLGVLVVFGVGQLFSALAPTFVLLTLARLLVASAHAIFWSIASVMATRLGDVRHAPLAIGMIATGSSIAMIFGLPLGRAIGLMVGWRMTFAVVAAVALAVVIYLAAVMPRIPAGEPFTLGQLPALLKNPLLISLYAVTILFSTGYYTAYSYIEPFMQQVVGMTPGLITVALTVFGFAGLVGSALFSRFYDGHGKPFLVLCIAGVAASLLLLGPLAGSIGAVVAACGVWGMCGTAFNVAFQAQIIDGVSADASAVAMSMFSGLFNFGIGAGSAIGGVVVSELSIGSIGFVGGAMVCACLLLTVTVLFRHLRYTVAQ